MTSSERRTPSCTSNGRHSSEELYYHEEQSLAEGAAAVSDDGQGLTEEERDVFSTLLMPEVARLLIIVGDVGVGGREPVRLADSEIRSRQALGFRADAGFTTNQHEPSPPQCVD